MLTFQGTHQLETNLAHGKELLIDPQFLVSALRDVEVQSISKDQATWLMKPHFSFIKTSLETTLTILKGSKNSITTSDEQKDSSHSEQFSSGVISEGAISEGNIFFYQVVSKGIGATAEVEISLQLTDLMNCGESGVHAPPIMIQWQAGITKLTGLLKLVPKGLIESVAKQVIEETWTNIDEQIKLSKS